MKADNLCKAKRDIIGSNNEVIIWKGEQCTYTVYEKNKHIIYGAFGQVRRFSYANFRSDFTLILEKKAQPAHIKLKHTNVGFKHRWDRPGHESFCMRCGLRRKLNKGAIYQFPYSEVWFGGVPKCEPKKYYDKNPH